MMTVWVLGLLGCIGPWPSSKAIEEPQVGFLYRGPVNDMGWTMSHEVGRAELEAAIPTASTHVMAGVTPSDAIDVIGRFIENGDNVIVGTSEDFGPALRAAALDHPDVRFLSCGSFDEAANLGSFAGRLYQTKYLAGLLAASSSCTGRIGYVASVSNPESVRQINAFTLGARAIDPNAIVLVSWVGVRWSVDLETAATERLLTAGIDVLTSGTDTAVPIEVANGRAATCGNDEVAVQTIGHGYTGACEGAGAGCLAVTAFEWGPVYVDLLEDMQAGVWVPDGDRWDGVQSTPEQGVVQLASLDPLVATATRVEVEFEAAQLGDTRPLATPFVGPLSDTMGMERVAAEAVLSDVGLRSMCWFVDGVRDVTAPDDPQTSVPAPCSP
ncbi:MAG: BMP family ABC transporter substrate-binding protein [Myxococcota bacterium]